VELDADYTGTAGRASAVTTPPSFGLSAFRRGAYWYLTLVTDARYFGPAKLVYLRAPDPAGPWTVPAGADPAISTDSCGGTAQSVSVLPSPSGPVAVAMIDLYRSSPGDASPKLPARAQHGDWNQAIAGRYWAPLEFGGSGRVRPMRCAASTRIPLAHPVPRGPAGTVWQPDCRVRSGTVLEQDWTVPAGTRLGAVRVPVFQRADVTDPALAPRVQPPTAVDAPLRVELVRPGGVDRWMIQPGAVSWAPRSVTVRLPRPVAGGARVGLRLATGATDGCYGILAGPATGDSVPALGKGRYAAVAGGRTTVAPTARMLFFPDRVR
jgi:hypothetical protein